MQNQSNVDCVTQNESGVIPVKEGQYVVALERDHYSYVVRADKVTEKTIRARRAMSFRRYGITPRHEVVFAGSKEECNALQGSFEDVRSARAKARREAKERYLAAIEPFALELQSKYDEAERDAAECRSKLLEKANASRR